nr:vWA domain-containing protein [uncultured Campylobacter sp.]
MNDNLLMDVLNGTKNIVNASNEILDSLLKNPAIKAKLGISTAVFSAIVDTANGDTLDEQLVGFIGDSVGSMLLNGTPLGKIANVILVGSDSHLGSQLKDAYKYLKTDINGEYYTYHKDFQTMIGGALHTVPYAKVLHNGHGEMVVLNGTGPVFKEISELEYKNYESTMKSLQDEINSSKLNIKMEIDGEKIKVTLPDNSIAYVDKDGNIELEDKETTSEPKLEIAILSDTTGSMSGGINSVKTQAKKIVETAFSKDENARIGVFGYNDPDVQTFTALTNNKSAILSAINALYARDGGDTPEMTYKGIINAASSSWSPNADKKIIIFGDAPAKDTYNKAEAYALLSGGSSDEPMARLALPASVLSLLAGESQSAELETSNDTSKIKVYAIQTGGGRDVEKEFKELAELSGGEYVKLENDSDVAQIILNIIEHGSVDLGKSYELDFSSEKNSQIIANEYGSIDINDELENLIFNYKNNDLIIKHPESGTQAIIKDFLAPNNELSKIKIRSEILEFSQIKELAYAQSGKDSVIYAKSSEGDFSLNDNISVFFSSDKNTATNITINNKKDNYIISSLKDDNITLGFGNDTFIYKGGRDSLKNSGGNDRVVFENISFNSAEFSIENYNLKISLGAGNELVVDNYFKEGKIEDFQFSDKGLKSDEVNLLIFKNIAEIA